MSRLIARGVGVALVGVLAACADTTQPHPTDRPDLARGPGWQEPPDPDRARDQRLARRFALALNNPRFRAEVWSATERSTVRERRIHLHSFLLASGGQRLTQLAQAAGEHLQRGRADLLSALHADLRDAPHMEVYLPVPGHRARWQGGPDVLVATARADGEIPVAFDRRGRKHLLDPRRPPDTPVIALQQWEGAQFAACDPMWCDSPWEPGDAGPPPVHTPNPVGTTGGLYLTGTRFYDTFESWLKGAPEFEIHMLGQKPGANELITYQCVGERAGAPYHFNQDDLTWTGSVLLFSQAQLDDFAARHPGQGLRLLILEDDDGPCTIKVDKNRLTELFLRVDAAHNTWTSGKDIKVTSFEKQFQRARSFYNVVSGLASFFQTNDDIVGTAVEDPGAASAILAGAGWIVKNELTMSSGALRLEMR